MTKKEKAIKKNWTISVLAIEEMEEELAQMEINTADEARVLQRCLDMIDSTLAEHDVLLYDDMMCPRYSIPFDDIK